MGIPRLIQTLQPFAERVILGQGHSENQLSNENVGPPLPRVTSVVIDGPSLVYHIYHCLLSVKASQKHYVPSSKAFPSLTQHPLLFQPSYLEISQAALAFIGCLQYEHGVEVQKIYFDGALPSAKRNVRLARLEEVRRKLVELRHLQGIWGVPTDPEGGPDVTAVPPCGDAYGQGNQDVPPEMDTDAVFQPRAPLRASFKAMPAPPFMVPAVIEYLQSQLSPRSSTSFGHSSQPAPSALMNRESSIQASASIVEIVPGEADVYCACHAKKSKSGIAILTSDSDLLAYSLGNDGSVILLNSLETSTQSSSSPSAAGEGRGLAQVLGTRYHAGSLATKLGISCSLQRFCFHRFLDPTIGISELKLRCRPASMLLGRDTEEEWKNFLRHYSTEDIVHHGAGHKVAEGESEHVRAVGRFSQSQLQGLDPRVAELATQFQHLVLCSSLASMENHLEANDGEPGKGYHVHMYLPLLLEDPCRDSVWSYGRSIRHLAYTVMQQYMLPPTAGALRRDMTITEYQRRGSRIVGLAINPHVPSNELHDQIGSLLQCYHTFRDRIASTEAGTACPPPASEAHFWRSFALSQVSEQRFLDGKTPPDPRWAKRFLTPTGASYAPTSWEDVHIQASLEAVLYSLRILKQVVWLCLGMTVSWPGEDEGGERVRELAYGLVNMPPLAEIMAAGERDSLRRGSESREPDIHQACQEQGEAQEQGDRFLGRGVDDSSRWSLQPAKRRRTIGRGRQGAEDEQSRKKGRPSDNRRSHGANMFAVLEEESE